MIKKLRIRITAVIMAGLTLLIAAVVVGIYIFMQHSETEETDKSVDSALTAVTREDSDKRSDDKKPEPPEASDPSKRSPSGNNRQPAKRQSSRSWISVLMSSEGTVKEIAYSSSYNKPDNEDEIGEAAESIAAQNSENGYIRLSDVSYRYFVKQSGGRTRVIFIDRTNQIETMGRLLIVLIAVGIGALILLFPISVLVSGWIVKPISRAWSSQKEFFANASHELKTPLTVISANIDVITSEPEKTVSEQDKWFEYIKSETGKMSKLINQMLYLSKDDREETKLLMSEFNASEAIEGVCLATEALAFENGHTLVTEIEPDISCKGDREMIERLANILIDNAIRHSVGSEEVKVALHHKKNRNILTVSNKGEYIPPEELSRLFDRFYRTDKSRTSSTGGFGLGLSIAKAIADKHKGMLTAASSPDRLTTFTFTWRE
ncbi:MAG TPA: hypothetical protein DDX72_06985 [Ruminococcaceae bacterium]|nr:hypothetical protein [Oscillospiraceae bacterium]